MNINSGEARLVLLCPAWKKYGTARTVKTDTVILHSRADDVVPFGDSEELARNSVGADRGRHGPPAGRSETVGGAVEGVREARTVECRNDDGDKNEDVVDPANSWGVSLGRSPGRRE
jgi:hypothetical protein